jgi:hypothetical protein
MARSIRHYNLILEIKMTNEIEQAITAFESGSHTPQQFKMLMDLLPDDVKDEMQKRAFEILGTDPNKPDAYAENGEPLWYVNTEKLNMPEDKLQEFYSMYANEIPKPDPKVSVLNDNVKIDRPLFVESGEKDEDGEPIMLISPDGAGLMAVHYALEDNLNGETNSRAIAIFNKWMAMARQQGVSSIIVDRLRQATKKETNTKRVLADVVRVTKKVCVVDAINAL